MTDNENSIDHEDLLERMTKIAIGLKGDDPINWPHYADEARELVEENKRLRNRAKHLERAIVAMDEAICHNNVSEGKRIARAIIE